MELKFRVIQSNDRGLITKQGDRTYARRGPAKGEEALELPTLFIWVSGKDRYLARCWTQWTGERLGDDFIYVVSRFRDVIDLHGDTRYHQWCSKQLRSELWTLERAALDLAGVSCPPPEAVYDGDRHKSAIYLQRRKERLREQTPELSDEEEELIQQIGIGSADPIAAHSSQGRRRRLPGAVEPRLVLVGLQRGSAPSPLSRRYRVCSNVFGMGW